jgi:hypothetical protein
VSFQIFKCGKGSRSGGLSVKMIKDAASISPELRQALPKGYDVALDMKSGQVAMIIGGPRKAHNGGHKALYRALCKVGAKTGQAFTHAGGSDPIPIELDGNKRDMAFVFNVRPAK